MKKITGLSRSEPRHVALILGFAIALGLVVHQAFFLLALAVVLVTATEWTMQKGGEFLSHLHPNK